MTTPPLERRGASRAEFISNLEEGAVGEQSHIGEKDCARQRPVGGGYLRILSLVYKTENGWKIRLCHR